MSSQLLKSEIVQFYRGKNVLITGSLGFCGRVFLEKMLRLLPGIGQIYLLIRDKMKQTAEERLKQLLESRLFAFHPHASDQLCKVIILRGDVSQPMFGMTKDQWTPLLSEVHILFHLAASVKFNASFRTNFNCNSLGTWNVLQVAKLMPNLCAFVHLSTAYSNCHLPHIEEKVYPMKEDVDVVVQQIRQADDASLDQYPDRWLQGRPNSYILTKWLAEQLIDKHRGQMPIAIARPAIVAPSIVEPCPGWIDNLNGPAGFSIVTSLGIGQVTDWNFDKQIDCFPVDFVANCLLAIGRNLGELRIDANQSIPVFNLVSTPLKPLDNYELLRQGKELMEESPSIYVIRPPTLPPKRCRMSRVEFAIKKFFYHVVFAYLIDMLLFSIGKKPIMRRVVQRMHFAMDLMRYFALHDWTFRCDNVISLTERMSTIDRRLFDFDIRPQDPVTVSRNIWLGIRRYLLHESDKTIPIALIKYKIQTAVYFFYQWTLKYCIIKAIVLFLFRFTCVQSVYDTIIDHLQSSYSTLFS